MGSSPLCRGRCPHRPACCWGFLSLTGAGFVFFGTGFPRLLMNWRSALAFRPSTEGRWPRRGQRGSLLLLYPCAGGVFFGTGVPRFLRNSCSAERAQGACAPAPRTSLLKQKRSRKPRHTPPAKSPFCPSGRGRGATWRRACLGAKEVVPYASKHPVIPLPDGRGFWPPSLLPPLGGDGCDFGVAGWHDWCWGVGVLSELGVVWDAFPVS